MKKADQYYFATGIGLCMIYLPAVLTVGFYFEKWRALATGLALCGSGVGVFSMGPLTKMLLAGTESWRMTIMVHAGLYLPSSDDVAFSLRKGDRWVKIRSKINSFLFYNIT